MNKMGVWAVLFVLLLASFSSAAVILDQSQEGFNYKARIYNLRSECQTFTSGESGLLAAIEVYLDGSSSYDSQAPATISILGTTGEDNHPDGSNVLWSQTFPTLSSGWFSVDLSSASLAVSEGLVYGIRIESSDSSSALPNDAWSYNRADNLYPAGQLWEYVSGSWRTQTVSGTPEVAPDAAFKTFVVVPEPATVILLVAGSALVATTRTVRRTA
jgi:hypothetical protein